MTAPAPDGSGSRADGPTEGRGRGREERIRTVFLGSGTFALPALRTVARHPDVELVGVVTAPPRPAGRGRRLVPSAVALLADELAMPALLTPARLRRPDAVQEVLALRPELLVLADYGQIVPPALLETRLGALNIHPSLLPRWRGASPIPAAILAGDTETGVSLIRMDAGLDTGPLVAVDRVPLGGEETAPWLETHLAHRGADLLGRTLGGWVRGEIEPRPQPAEGATLTRPLRRDDGRVDPARGASELARQIRAYQPWPGTWGDTDAGRLTIWSADPLVLAGLPPAPTAAPGLGTLLQDGERLALVVADGALRLRELQLAGGRRMTAAELLRGRPALAGSRLRDPQVA